MKYFMTISPIPHEVTQERHDCNNIKASYKKHKRKKNQWYVSKRSACIESPWIVFLLVVFVPLVQSIFKKNSDEKNVRNFFVKSRVLFYPHYGGAKMLITLLLWRKLFHIFHMRYKTGSLCSKVEITECVMTILQNIEM